MTDTTKRYRLLKDLPDSKVGDIYIWNDGMVDVNAYYKNGDTDSSYWCKENVENNPEWFEEVLPVSEPPERIKVTVYPYGGNGFNGFTTPKIEKEKFPLIQQAIESALNDTVVEVDVKNWGVFSAPPLIKMYSQSEVDAIRADTWYAARKITDKVVGEIDFKDGDRCPFYEKYFNSINDYLSSLNLNSNDTGKEDNETKSANWRSENLSKQSAPEPSALPNKEQDKPVLFTTEDGVEYRDSLTDYYEVRDFKHSGRCNGMSWYRPENGNKYFSTSEAAEQYILENKPFLSIKDIEIMANYKTNFKFELSKSELYHYAKQKLNK